MQSVLMVDNEVTPGMLYAANWLQTRVGRIVEQTRVNGDVVWRVVPESPRRPFLVRVADKAFELEPAALRSWLFTLADHAGHRAPAEPGHYHVTCSGVRVRGRR